jgi:exonuclease III
MAVRPRTNEVKASRLAYWSADGVRGRKLELEQFLSEKGVDIFLLNETHLESGRDLTFANYVYHRTDRPNRGGGTAILVRRDIDHYAVPLSGLQHLDATAMHLELVTRPVKLVAAYLSPTRPLIESDLSECLSGGFPVLMAGDLNAKHTDWNSRLTTARASLLRDYANRNTCLICGPDSPTTVPYTHDATLDVLDIVVVKDFVLPVYLTVCSALRSDHLPILIDTMC